MTSYTLVTFSGFPIWHGLDELQLQATIEVHEKLEGDVYLPSLNPKEHEYVVLNGPSLLGLQQALFDPLLPHNLQREVTFCVGLPYRSGICAVTVKATISVVQRTSEPEYWDIGGSIIIPAKPTDRPNMGFLWFEGKYSTRTRRGTIFF